MYISIRVIVYFFFFLLGWVSVLWKTEISLIYYYNARLGILYTRTRCRGSIKNRILRIPMQQSYVKVPKRPCLISLVVTSYYHLALYHNNISCIAARNVYMRTLYSTGSFIYYVYRYILRASTYNKGVASSWIRVFSQRALVLPQYICIL